MIRICYLTDAWTPIFGGGQTHILELSKWLAQNKDVYIEILAPNLLQNGQSLSSIETLVANKVYLRRVGPTFTFPSKIGYILFILSASVYALFSERFDIYHSHSVPTAILLPLIGFIKKAKTILTIHGRWRNLTSGGIYNRLGISKLLIDTVIDRYPYSAIISVSTENLTNNPFVKMQKVIGNAINVEKFEPKTKIYHPSHPKLLWVGRLDPVKDFTTLIRGVSSIKENLNCSLTIVGDGPERRNVLNLIKEYQLERVTLTGQLNQAELIRKYHQSDLLLLTSTSEGFPIVILEALASKLPVVASAVGECPKLIENSQAGEIFEPTNFQELSQKVLSILNKDLSLLGNNGNKFVRQHYSWNKIGNEIFALYNNHK